MLERKKKMRKARSMLEDVCLITFSYGLALWMRMVVLAYIPDSTEITSPAQSILVVLASAVLMVILYAFLGLYEVCRPFSITTVLLVCLANGAGFLLAGTILFLFRLMNYSRLALLIFYIAACMTVLTKHFAEQKIQQANRSSGKGCTRVLLVGAGGLAQRYYRTIQQEPGLGFSFLGYCADQSCEAMPNYLGRLDQVRSLLAQGKADAVVVAPETMQAQEINQLIAACGRFGISISIMPAYNDYIPATPRVIPVEGIKLFTVRSSPNRGVAWTFFKRAMDIGMSLCGLIILSPIMLVTAIAIKATSPGPVIFCQQRAGKNGAPFSMYKFRSMCVDAESRLDALKDQNESDGPTFKIAQDPRVTPVGRFIRKTSIDELPQLVNILKGDMSVVGPRPPLLSEVEQYSDWDWGRLTVKPGLTCYWQISGRSNLSFSEWMRLDLKYVEEQGFLTDVKILFKTVWTVLSGKGAY